LIKDKRKVLEESPRLKALVKLTTELYMVVLRHVTAPKSSFFGESACSAVGRSWPLSACGLLIQSHNPSAGKTLGLTLSDEFSSLL
jgi:hypothetical protein